MSEIPPPPAYPPPPPLLPQPMPPAAPGPSRVLVLVLAVIGVLIISGVVVAATMYRFLTSRTTNWREVLPGAVFAGFVFTVLQYAGTLIMTRALDSAESVYGDFAGLLALMTWISIHALVALVGAELNAALAIRRAPDARPATVPDLAP